MGLGEFVLTLALVVLGALLFAGPVGAARNRASAFSTTLGCEGASSFGDTGGVGFATITLDPAGRQIRYRITASGVEPGAEALIHEASGGRDGPPVVRLKPLSNGSSAGSVHATRSLINKISKNRSRFYINVHSARHPGGALRGQL